MPNGDIKYLREQIHSKIFKLVTTDKNHNEIFSSLLDDCLKLRNKDLKLYKDKVRLIITIFIANIKTVNELFKIALSSLLSINDKTIKLILNKRLFGNYEKFVFYLENHLNSQESLSRCVRSLGIDELYKDLARNEAKCTLLLINKNSFTKEKFEQQLIKKYNRIGCGYIILQYLQAVSDVDRKKFYRMVLAGQKDKYFDNLVLKFLRQFDDIKRLMVMA